MIRLIAGFVCLTLLAGCEKQALDQTTSEQWFQAGQQAVATMVEANTGKAKNIILVVGDGMGVATLTAARIFSGQQLDLAGEEYQLSFEGLPYSALIKTYNTDLQTPDSAGTMTALISGQKTSAGVLGVNKEANRADCQSALGTEIHNIADLAKKMGKKTAIVTTTRVTHATPAALYAHSPERNWESDDGLTEQAKQLGCKDIARQLVEDWPEHQLDIVLGGGRRHFLPESEGGKRQDKKNLIEQWRQQGRQYVEDAEQLAELPILEQPLLGLFSSSHIEYVYQRPAEQPGLMAMSKAALKQLERHEAGYLLVIEAGRIDHGHHDGQAYKALTEAQELHNTLAWVQDNVDLTETLLIVTADHSHTMTLLGYPTRGNPILSNIELNNGDVLNYPSVNYRNGPGANHWHESHEHPANVHQPALVPLYSETHGGEDVALYAAGPWAHLLGGTLEQHWVYHVMKHALLAN